MNMTSLKTALCGKDSGKSIRFLENEPMNAHCSFHIGGSVAMMILPSDIDELVFSMRTARKFGAEPFVLGHGTNVLAADGNIDRVVITTFPALSSVRLLDGDIIEAEAGTLLAQAAVFALKNGLSGLEFAHGIPGTVGGAVRMNAGAYGGEMKDILVSTEYLGADGEIHTLVNAGHSFAHRYSVFAENGGTVLRVRFKLNKGVPEEIKARMDDYAARRRESQPLEMPSAGSSFRRSEGRAASAMIDSCGLKGLRVGDAAVSEKHAGFVVNLGDATCADVKKLMSLVCDRVLEAYGTVLEPEIVCLD